MNKNKLEFLFFVVILLLDDFTRQASSLKTSDLCEQARTQCRKTNHSVVCKQTTCGGATNFKCGTQYCARDKSACMLVNSMRSHLQHLEAFNLSNAFKSQVRKYETFLARIKQCGAVRFQWEHKKVCLNGKNCRLVEKLPIRLGGVKFLTRIDCVCREVFRFKCGPDACASNKLECIKFNLARSYLNLNASLMGVESCQNDNLLIQS